MITQAERSELVRRASEARRHAYAPYSKYRVGAALLAESGEVYTGVNVENAVYPTGTCAERTAIFKAVSEGERSFTAIAVVTENGGTPCGSCRQMLAEFGLDTLVLVADAGGRVVSETNLRTLLPQAFGAADLPPRD
jgi:cytidine deaminase